MRFDFGVTFMTACGGNWSQRTCVAGRVWREIESVVQQRDHDSREVRRSGQIMNTNMCWWAVLSHVDLLFRDAYAGRVTWNTNTTSLAGWNLQHFFHYFSDCQDKTKKNWTNICWMKCSCAYLKAVLLAGVECFFFFTFPTRLPQSDLILHAAEP